MVLRQAVAVADVRVLHPVQQHVHAADAQHGGVEVEAVEQAVVEVLQQRLVAQQLRVVLAQVLAGGDQEAGGAAGRVHDHVLRRGRRHLHHEADDVAWRAELAVLPGSGDLAEHVLVEVALGVPVLHRQAVQHVHHPRQQRRGRDGEARVLHVVGVGGAVPAQGAEEREHVLPHHGEHLGRRRRCGTATSAGPRRGDRGCPGPQGRPGARPSAWRRGRLPLLQRLQLVEAADEEEVGDLLDHLDGIGDAARPEAVPDLVDLTADVPG